VHSPSLEALPPEARIALAWSPPRLRARLGTALALDRRLARIAMRTREPMLGQMRLAWWREALSKPLADRPRGDLVLDSAGQHWAGREAGLIALVDGWEVLVSAPQIGADEAEAFARQRAAFFALLPDEAAMPAMAEAVAAAARVWALADAAAAVSDPAERAVLIAAGQAAAARPARLPAALRGLAVLAALGRRALARGGRPLMEGRAAALSALRGAIFLR